MSSVLTDAELAELLQLDISLIKRLIRETNIPRLTIAGKVRFITAEVLSWLSDQTELLVPEAPVEEPVIAAPDADTLILPAEDDEVPFISKVALAALGTGASDPSQNLARQQARDVLAALGDAIHPALVRLSNERLHPSPAETDRTSPWRLEPKDEAITHITMTWAEGEGPPGFGDRPHMALSITGDAVEFSVKIPSGQALEGMLVRRARSAGAMVGSEGKKGAWSVTFLYEVARGTPTAATIQTRLRRDAKTLVPLWLEATSEVKSA